MTECIEWQFSCDSKGYGHARVGGKLRSVHRVSWERMHGSIPGGMHVLHKCDNPLCFNVAHLFLGTHSDNMRDMKSKGRGRSGQLSGEGNSVAKLTNEQVLAIRELRGQADQETIAGVFGIAQSTVSQIQNRKRWTHV